MLFTLRFSPYVCTCVCVCFQVCDAVLRWNHCGYSPYVHMSEVFQTPAFASFTRSCDTALQPAVKTLDSFNTKSEFTCFHVRCLLLTFALNTRWSVKLSLKVDPKTNYSKWNLRHHHASAGRSITAGVACMRCFQQYKKLAVALNAYIKYYAHKFVQFVKKLQIYTDTQNCTVLI